MAQTLSAVTATSGFPACPYGISWEMYEKLLEVAAATA